jgi:hypothetical protein
LDKTACPKLQADRNFWHNFTAPTFWKVTLGRHPDDTLMTPNSEFKG